MKKDHDYNVFLAIIAIWLMVSALAQCESARHLAGIEHELIFLKYK